MAYPRTHQLGASNTSEPHVLMQLCKNGMGFSSRRTEQATADDTHAESYAPRTLLTSKVTATVSPQSISRCIAIVLKELIIMGEEQSLHGMVAAPYRIFNKPERRIHMGNWRNSGQSLRTSVVPVEQAAMEYECAVASLYYIQKLVMCSNEKFFFTGKNWKSVVLAAMLLANKTWDDCHMSNRDYAYTFPGTPLRRINRLEIAFMAGLGHNLMVSRSQYIRVHSAIQELIAKDELIRWRGHSSEACAADRAEGYPLASRHSEESNDECKTVSDIMESLHSARGVSSHSCTQRETESISLRAMQLLEVRPSVPTWGHSHSLGTYPSGACIEYNDSKSRKKNLVQPARSDAATAEAISKCCICFTSILYKSGDDDSDI